MIDDPDNGGSEAGSWLFDCLECRDIVTGPCCVTGCELRTLDCLKDGSSSLTNGDAPKRPAALEFDRSFHARTDTPEAA